MKFKSAEADWNTLFVSQQVEGRNPGATVVRKLYRPNGTRWLYWRSEEVQSLLRKEDANEQIFEVCCKFLGKCFSRDRFDGDGTKCARRKDEEEGGYDC